jgi:surface polysaccharide O-acyltransferase-like enzyme
MKSRVIWVDNLRLLACFAVVFLHVANSVMLGTPDIRMGHWWIGSFYDSLVRWCVPCFVMISGFLLLNPEKEEDISAFYKKRASRILTPIVFWTLFFSICSVIKWRVTGKPISVLSLVGNVLVGKPYYHIWYLYMTLGLYLFTPFLRRTVKRISGKMLCILCAILFGISMISNVALHFLVIGNTASHFYSDAGFFINSSLLYLPYFLCGHLLGRIYPTKCSTGLCFAFVIVFAVLTSLGCYFVTVQFDPDVGSYFYSYLSITVVPMSIAFFIRARSVVKSLVSERLLEKMVALSLGVYLIHPVYIDLLIFFGVEARMYNPAILIPAIAILVFVFSFLTALVLSRIPLFAKVV